MSGAWGRSFRSAVLALLSFLLHVFQSSLDFQIRLLFRFAQCRINIFAVPQNLIDRADIMFIRNIFKDCRRGRISKRFREQRSYIFALIFLRAVQERRCTALLAKTTLTLGLHAAIETLRL